MRKFLSFLAILFFLGASGFAQERTITGRVTSVEGTSLPSITVQVKGTNIGTSTNSRGEFTITVSKDATLILSGIGFQVQEVKVDDKTHIDVFMQAETKTLEQVVVTALGIKRSEKAIGYAISQVKPDALVEKSEPDVLKNLQGKVPGVDIRIGQGAPGASTRIQIRGVSSIGLGTQPLIVVDGIPYSNIEVGAGSAFSGGGASGTGLNNLDVNNIESMTILKGAAAASLYGSRAANGVVLITTKSGTAEKGAKSFNLSYNSGYSIEKIGALPDFQNLYGAGANMTVLGANGSWGGKFGKGVIYNSSGGVVRPSSSGVDSIPASTWSALFNAYPELFPNGLAPYKAYPDNVRGLFETGHLAENSLNFNGGNNQTTFNATISNVTQDGYIMNSSYKKNNASLGGQTIIGKLTVGGSISYAHSKQIGGYFGQAQSFLTQWGRTFTMARNWNMEGYPITDKSGNQIGFNTGQYTNPLWAAYHNVITTEDDRSVVNFRASFKATKFLTLFYTFGANNYSLSRDAIIDQSSYGSSDNAVGNITETFFKNTDLQSLFYATISPKLNGNFTLDIRVGNDIFQRTSRSQGYYGSNFITPGLYNLTNTNTKNFTDDSRHKRRLVGFFSEATLGYKGFVFLNAAGRLDMTSTLPYKNSKYFYPSVSGSFIWSDAFKLRNNWLDYGKIRVGFARAGNDANPQNGQDVFSLYSTSFLGNPRAERGGTTFDPNLTPEFTNELEIGMDFQLFKNRISAEITWYDKKTTDLIYPVDVPVTTGYTSFYTNIGEIENKGWEIGLDVKPIVTRDFTWKIHTAYTRNTNTVNKLVEGLTRIAYAGYTDFVGSYLEPGMPFGYFRGTVAARYQGKLLIDPNTGWAVEDQNNTYLGNPNPKYKLGITNEFNYKGFHLSALFDMTVGGLFYSESIGAMLGRGVTRDNEDREHNVVIDGYYANMTPVVDDKGESHFVPLLVDGKPVQNQTKISVNDLYFQPGVANNTSFATNSAGEYNLYGATVYHLREITLGYDLPIKWITKLKLSNINVSLSGRNLWFYAPDIPKHTHHDPELSSFGTSAAQGYDIVGAPAPKRYGINLRVTF